MSADARTMDLVLMLNPQTGSNSANVLFAATNAMLMILAVQRMWNSTLMT